MLIHIDPGYSITNDHTGNPIAIHDEHKKICWLKPKPPSPFKQGDIEKRASEMLRMYVLSREPEKLLLPPPQPLKLVATQKT